MKYEASFFNISVVIIKEDKVSNFHKRTLVVVVNGGRKRKPTILYNIKA